MKTQQAGVVRFAAPQPGHNLASANVESCIVSRHKSQSHRRYNIDEQRVLRHN